MSEMMFFAASGQPGGGQQADVCPRCGNRLAPDAPQGLCPKCLLQQGFSEPSGRDSTAAYGAPFTAPAPA